MKKKIHSKEENKGWVFNKINDDETKRKKKKGRHRVLPELIWGQYEGRNLEDEGK